MWRYRNARIAGRAPGAGNHSLVGRGFVAGLTGGSRRLRRVPGLGRAGVTVRTTQILVNTVRQGLGIHRDGLALRIHHASAGSVTGKTVIIGEQ